jgi:hypothetical protein
MGIGLIPIHVSVSMLYVTLVCLDLTYYVPVRHPDPVQFGLEFITYGLYVGICIRT